MCTRKERILWKFKAVCASEKVKEGVLKKQHKPRLRLEVKWRVGLADESGLDLVLHRLCTSCLFLFPGLCPPLGVPDSHFPFQSFIIFSDFSFWAAVVWGQKFLLGTGTHTCTNQRVLCV